MRKRKACLLAALLATVMSISLLLSGCGGGGQSNRLRVGSEQFPESRILAEIAVILIEEKTDFEVTHIDNLGGSTAMHIAMESGELDMYPTYTGSQFTGVLNMEVTDDWKQSEKVFNFVKEQFSERFDAHVFDPYGFNNTYAIAVTRETHEALKLEKVSDLIPHAPNMLIATDMTLQHREGDGFSDFAEAYGLTFKDAREMDYGLMYRAVKSGDVDAAVAYSTDGRITEMDLVILEDDRQFFPPYDGILVMRNDVLEQYPELGEVLGELSGRIDTETMTRLNYYVDTQEREYKEVIREFLREEGLI